MRPGLRPQHRARSQGRQHHVQLLRLRRTQRLPGLWSPALSSASAGIERFFSQPAPETIARAAALLDVIAPPGPLLPFAVVSDFDGVIATPDLCNATLEAFAKPEWLASEERWLRGEITSQQNLTAQFSTVAATAGQLAAFHEKAAIAPGFARFVRALGQMRIPFAILSDGLDLYIAAILKRLGLEGIFFAVNQGRPSPSGLQVAFPHRDTICHQCGCCKAAFVLALRQRARRVLYIGDGMSDLCAAAYATDVFAAGRLLGVYTRLGRPCRPFTTFPALLPHVQALAVQA